MHTMNNFELKSHAEYAKKYPDHEVSFFESMIIPPWANSIFGATNHSDDDLLNIIFAYKAQEVLDDVLNATHPIIAILLYYRLLIFEKLLLSLEEKEGSRKTIKKLHEVLDLLKTKYPHFFNNQILSEKDIRSLLNILQLTCKLDDELKDPYVRFSKVKRLLARFYRLIITFILADDPNELTFIACYINPYFQKPGGSNNKITKAALEVFNYTQQADEWIVEYSDVALIALDNTKPELLDISTQNALYEAALHFDEVALAILNHPALLKKYSPQEQAELQNHITESHAEGLLESSEPENQTRPNTYQLSSTERKENKKQAIRLYNYFFRLSRKFFRQKAMALTSSHLIDMLTIIINNDNDILPIIADYWHKTYRQFKIHSHTTEFKTIFTPYINTIINFFNDKDIGERDDATLKAFATEFIEKCKSAKINLKKSGRLKENFEKILDDFIALENSPS